MPVFFWKKERECRRVLARGGRLRIPLPRGRLANRDELLKLGKRWDQINRCALGKPDEIDDEIVEKIVSDNEVFSSDDLVEIMESSKNPESEDDESEENSDSGSENTSSSISTSEALHAEIDVFPVNMIALEKCDITFDKYIMNEDQ